MSLPEDLKYSSKQQHCHSRPPFQPRISALGMTSSPQGAPSQQQTTNQQEHRLGGAPDFEAGEAATEPLIFLFPLHFLQEGGQVPSAAKQQKVPESQGYFWDSRNWYLGQASRSLVHLVSGGFVLLVEVKEYHQSCIHLPHRHLVSWRARQAREGIQRKGTRGRLGKDSWPRGRELHRSSPRPHHAPPSKAQLSLTPDVILAAPTVGVSFPFSWIFCRKSPHEECG